jgi:uncharacterized protein (TIGR03435 family)
MKCPSFRRLPITALIVLLVVMATLAVSATFGGASTPPSRGHSPSQNTATIGPDLKYEPISIKLLKRKAIPEDRGLIAGLDQDGISVRSVTLIGLLQSAYAAIDGNSIGPGLKLAQIIGLPDWASTDLYAIEGKMDPSVAIELSKLSSAQQELARAHMLQAMLADRFKLQAHSENREGAVYFLVIAKNGPKLKQATPGETYPKSGFGGAVPYQAGFVVMASPDPGATKRLGLGAAIDKLTPILSAWLHCPVIDKTGLTGKYDFQLQWTENEDAETGPEANWPSLFTAIQQQLGLKLESAKGPVPVLVIEHVEKPSGN